MSMRLVLAVISKPLGGGLNLVDDRRCFQAEALRQATCARDTNAKAVARDRPSDGRSLPNKFRSHPCSSLDKRYNLPLPSRRETNRGTAASRVASNHSVPIHVRPPTVRLRRRDRRVARYRSASSTRVWQSIRTVGRYRPRSSLLSARAWLIRSAVRPAWSVYHLRSLAYCRRFSVFLRRRSRTTGSSRHALRRAVRPRSAAGVSLAAGWWHCVDVARLPRFFAVGAL